MTFDEVSVVVDRDFVQLLTCTEPNDPSLVVIQLQPIRGHPFADTHDTGGKSHNCVSVV